jgi:hypothetical protein
MKAAGYRALIDFFHLEVVRPAVASFIHEKSERVSLRNEARTEEYYPARYDPGDSWRENLLFALKHEGVNLEVLAALFRLLSEEDMTGLVRSAPTGRYVRTAWFIYEWLTGRVLPIPDLNQGNYFPVLDATVYYALPATGEDRRARRQRVYDNLPGTRDFCPLVRRTETLRSFDEERLDLQAAEKIGRYPEGLVARATNYLYSKETRSSWAIESLRADSKRTARFVELLRMAGRSDCFSEEDLTRLQNAIVEERYRAKGFRVTQNYVGESLGSGKEWIHYVPPRPEDLPGLMEGWSVAARSLVGERVHPVVSAAVTGFGFVFLHPFDDGNGRLHRFLIHHVLAAGRFTPEGLIFPVSATMLEKRREYDGALEYYSREIALHVDYSIDKEGVMTVKNDTASFYRYPDLTVQTEALFGFIRETIDRHLTAELEYLEIYDAAREEIRNLLDMPDRKLDLFLRLCLEGKGRVSKTKRHLFPELEDGEISRLEALVEKTVAAREKP